MRSRSDGDAMGRAFVVEGEQRMAEPASRDDWLASDLAPRVDGLAPELRERLAAYWSRVGRVKHASIASFARFALQLLSLGAPPELISRAHAAMSDETRHARFAFALASTYGARAVGPGALSLDGALGEETLEGMLKTVIMEGCVGDAVAGRAAKEALEQVDDPALRFVLREVARDEAEHALLAWRSVIWMTETFGDRAEGVLRDAIAALRESVASEPVVSGVADERSFGMVSERAVIEIRRDIIEHGAIAGLEAVLFGEPPPASTEGGRLTLV